MPPICENWSIEPAPRSWGRKLFELTDGWGRSPVFLENPQVIEGDRVTHLIYAVRK